MDTLYIWIILTIAGACLHLAVSKKPRTKNRIIEVFLLYVLVVQVGVASIWNFMGHTFMADYIAEYIGWPPGSPFQFEVAVANLSYGILGLLCAKFRGNFWTATIIAYSTFYLGAAYGHIIDILENANYAPGNAGAPLYLDIAIPAVLIAFFAAYKITIRPTK
ncbi:MAG: DUF6790 family protein [Methanocella sp.]|jgi:hypothetical protein